MWPEYNIFVSSDYFANQLLCIENIGTKSTAEKKTVFRVRTKHGSLELTLREASSNIWEKKKKNFFKSMAFSFKKLSFITHPVLWHFKLYEAKLKTSFLLSSKQHFPRMFRNSS